jgi:hypothetical protein
MSLKWSQVAWQIYIASWRTVRHSSKFKGITLTIWEAIVFVLLMRCIYGVRHWDSLRLPEDWYRHSKILRFYLRNLRGCNVCTTYGRDSWCRALKWAQFAWYTCKVLWWFVKRSSNIKVLHQYSNCCNAGITEGRYCNEFDQRVGRQHLCKYGGTRNNRGRCAFFSPRNRRVRCDVTQQ